MHKVCGYHLSPRNYSLKTLSDAIKCCECLLARPRGGNLTHNGDPRVGKLAFENLKMSNFPWVATRPPHPNLGQNNAWCIIYSWSSQSIKIGIDLSIDKNR